MSQLVSKVVAVFAVASTLCILVGVQSKVHGQVANDQKSDTNDAGYESIKGDLGDWFYFFGPLPEINVIQSNKLVAVARDKQDSDMLFRLSEVVGPRGIPSLRDFDLQKALLKESATLGQSTAQATLGLKLLFGDKPFAQDSATGAVLLEKSIESNDSFGYLFRGIAKLNKHPSFKSVPEGAASDIERSLILGNVRAHFFTSLVRQEEGDGTSARTHLEIGTKLGDPQAINGLALLLWASDDPKIKDRALSLSAEAAATRNPDFQYNYASMLVEHYKNNLGKDVDDLLSDSASGGSKDALYLRGALHFNGSFKNSDKLLGYQLVEEAAKAGHVGAIHALERMHGKP